MKTHGHRAGSRWRDRPSPLSDRGAVRLAFRRVCGTDRANVRVEKVEILIPLRCTLSKNQSPIDLTWRPRDPWELRPSKHVPGKERFGCHHAGAPEPGPELNLVSRAEVTLKTRRLALGSNRKLRKFFSLLSAAEARVNRAGVSEL